MEGFDIGDAGKVLNQLKSQLASPFDRTARPDPAQWSIWSNPAQSQPRADAPAPAAFPRAEAPQAPALRPEQMVGTSQADAATKQAVYQAVDQARKQSNRTVAANQFMQAINMSNNSHDASLQAMSKVEYGLANLGWGFSEEGFKWILEAGSNNPSLYNSQSNQSFLQRLGQAGMPQSAVDTLIYNGSQDPNWYLKDPQATKKLDASMTGPAFVPPTQRPDGNQPQEPGRDPMAPPVIKPEPLNPNIQQPGPAGAWMKDQFMQALQSASREPNHQNAFGFYRQATDMADRSADKTLQATARVETGLALISWGNTADGFKWLLDAGSKNPALYDSRVNQAFQERLRAGGITDATMDMYLKNGQQDPNWYLRDSNAATTLATVMKSGNNPNSRPGEAPYLPIPNPFPVQPNPQVEQPRPLTPHIKPNPFGG